MINLDKKPSLFESILNGIYNKNKPLDIDNGLDKDVGDGREKNVSIKPFN